MAALSLFLSSAVFHFNNNMLHVYRFSKICECDLEKHSKKFKLVTKAKIPSHFPCSFFLKIYLFTKLPKQNFKS